MKVCDRCFNYHFTDGWGIFDPCPCLCQCHYTIPFVVKEDVEPGNMITLDGRVFPKYGTNKVIGYVHRAKREKG